MKRVTPNVVSAPGTPAGENNFSGTVHLHRLLPAGDPATVQASLVSFSDGARTHWHSHAGGQLLHVVEGRGRVQSRGEPAVDLEPGDIVVAEPGEEHWHGAAQGASMRHLAVSMGAARWLEPVDPGQV